MNVAIIAAAGIGKRMGNQGKQYLHLRGKPVLAHTLGIFQDCSIIDQIIVLANSEDLVRCRELVNSYGFDKVSQCIEGGEERQDSVHNGLTTLPYKTKIAIIHDGARPLITSSVIERSVLEMANWDGVVVGVPVKDTLKRVREKQIVNTINRQEIWHTQTPQVFVADLLKDAYQRAMAEGFYGTDDSVLMERLGYKIGMIMGSYENIKITTPEDLVVAEAILENRANT